MTAGTTDGLILLAFIALLVGFGVARIRRRSGLAGQGRFAAGVVVLVVIAVLILWATSRR